ncbi:MAG: DNA gyrase inhibitor YacG [Holosporales bacterium]|jgi:endogenous inhibitor of DNA gyrase (YacG/DUF329 family)|nr:DNA gyrase inhibitor YacG [Holosporales bacterium]
MQCPICGKKIQDNMPFCSKTCQLIDLNRWFKGNYRIQTDEKPNETEVQSELSQSHLTEQDGT